MSFKQENLKQLVLNLLAWHIQIVHIRVLPAVGGAGRPRPALMLPTTVGKNVEK